MTRDSAHNDGLGPVLTTLVELARTNLGQISPEQCLWGEQAIERRITGTKRTLAPWLARGIALAAALPVLLGAALLLRHVLWPDPLGYQVENGFIRPGQIIAASGSAQPVMRFSDGTEVRVGLSAQARLRFVTARGAALAIDRGQIHAEVVHSSASEWRFDAGPFSIRVTGTAFGLDWQPENDRFDLRLEHGSVTVTAPVANDPIPVRAGQWLTIRTRSNEVLIRDLRADIAEPFLADEPATGVGISSDLNTSDSGIDAVTTLSEEPHPLSPSIGEIPRNWSQYLAEGKLDHILRDAQALGLDECLAKVNSGELAALADAARYTRKNDIARKALSAQRHRYPGSRRATEAAFLLGKLAEAGKNDTGAIGYFDTYLVEAPFGTYASEALGRKMTIVQHSVGSTGARPLAQDYIAKYPQGTYAAVAQAILHSS